MALTNWFTRKSISPTRSSRLSGRNSQLESLEDRKLFVVGITAVPAIVEAGNHDGVVRLDLNKSDGSGAMCSGTLLSSGKHILTAAHCVTNDRGVIDVSNVDVLFRTESGDKSLRVERSGFDIHPSWNGHSDGSFTGDLAILELPELAPSTAQRYDLYRSTLERGRTFTVVGYGRAGHDKPDPSVARGERRLAFNRVEGTSHDSGGPAGSVLRYENERHAGQFSGWAAQGDSGGPLLIDGRIAGVTSFGSETNGIFGGWLAGTPEGEEGEESVAMRVSHYANWIDSVLDQSQEVVLQMNGQPQGGDGRQDFIDVDRIGDDIHIRVNLVTVGTLNANSITRLRIHGSSDADHVEFKDDVNFSTYLSMGRGSDTLRGSDTANTFTIWKGNEGWLNSHIYFLDVENLQGGVAADRFRFHSDGWLSGSVHGGRGTQADTLDYSLWSSAVRVDLGRQTATSVFGSASEIEDVIGGSGNDTLVGNHLANRLFGSGGHDLLMGGLGDDHLYGEAGNDVLIGEGGVDAIFGGNDDDLLIGDSFTGSADNVRREWMQATSYASRMFNLRNGTGLTNGTRLNSFTRAIADSAVDALTGGLGDDWFWGTTSETRDRLTREVLN